jgi:hypothetical protein
MNGDVSSMAVCDHVKLRAWEAFEPGTEFLLQPACPVTSIICAVSPAPLEVPKLNWRLEVLSSFSFDERPFRSLRERAMNQDDERGHRLFIRHNRILWVSWTLRKHNTALGESVACDSYCEIPFH